MSIGKDDDENISFQTEAYYEELASQEEIYLEETEEELRVILTSDNPTPFKRPEKSNMPGANNNPRIAKSVDEQLDHAAEELITGDSDDPPLTEETVVEMLRMTSNARRPGHSSDV
jgi:hypothetical protein